MKIGVFHTTLPEPDRKIGGVEAFVHRLANRLVDRGNQVTVFSFASFPPSDAKYSMHRIGRPVLTSRALRLALCPVLLNRVDWSGLDVLSLHGDDWFFADRCVPTVRTFHGSALCEARSATRMRRRVTQYMVYPAEVIASRLADRSYTAAASMPRGYRLDGVLPLAVERFESPLGSAGERSRQPSVLFVGTWEGRKRGRFLRDTFVRDVLPQVPDAELWMVSDRCDEGPSVRWFRYPTDTELGRLYRNAWVFCLPSTYEGFGMPYLEAMAYGTPVLASPNPGARWVTAEGKAGGLAADRDLAASLTSLLTDSAARSRYIAAGCHRAGDFTWDRVCSEYERAFSDAIAAYRKSRTR